MCVVIISSSDQRGARSEIQWPGSWSAVCLWLSNCLRPFLNFHNKLLNNIITLRLKIITMREQLLAILVWMRVLTWRKLHSIWLFMFNSRWPINHCKVILAQFARATECPTNKAQAKLHQRIDRVQSYNDSDGSSALLANPQINALNCQYQRQCHL